MSPELEGGTQEKIWSESPNLEVKRRREKGGVKHEPKAYKKKDRVLGRQGSFIKRDSTEGFGEGANS